MEKERMNQVEMQPYHLLCVFLDLLSLIESLEFSVRRRNNPLLLLSMFFILLFPLVKLCYLQALMTKFGDEVAHSLAPDPQISQG